MKDFSAIMKIKNKQKNCWDKYLLKLTWLVLIVIFITRWSINKHLPLTGLLDSVVIFCLCITSFLVIFERYFNIKAVILPIISSIFLAMLCIFIYTNDISEKKLLAPALQSPLFVPHILFYLSGYAMMAINVCASTIRLISQKKIEPEDNVNISHLDIMIRITLAIGFVLITVGFMIGIVWAKYVWGSYWGWDPKESWALITWLFYLVGIHLISKRRVLSKKLLIINIGAFLTMLFTYFGVRFLPTAISSVHIYK